MEDSKPGCGKRTTMERACVDGVDTLGTGPFRSVRWDEDTSRTLLVARHARSTGVRLQ